MANPVFGGVDWAGMLSQTIYWLGWLLLAIAVVLVFVAIYWWMTFNIRVRMWPIYGSTKDGVFSIGRERWNRVKWVKNRTAWRALKPLMNRRNIEPFDSEYIYEGNKVYCFDLNNQWIPGRININQSEHELRAEVNPVPYWVRNWQSLETSNSIAELSKPNWWDQNKSFVYMLFAVGFCCVLTGVTVYYTYNFATGGLSGMNNLADALRGISQGVARPPA